MPYGIILAESNYSSLWWDHERVQQISNLFSFQDVTLKNVNLEAPEKSTAHWFISQFPP